MFVENLFPDDPRVRNECEALSAAGYCITVVCLRKRGEPFSEIVQGIQVYRLASLSFFKKTPGPRLTLLQQGFLKVASVVGYLGEYLYFTIACLCMSVYVAFKHGFDVIHAHNPPDTLFLVAALYKPFGKKFIFDHHDLSPELYQSRYGANNNLLTRTLRLMEKCSLKLANVTIATSESYKQLQIQRGGVKPEKAFVVRNGPDFRRMTIHSPSKRLRQMGKCILCYVGIMNPQDGVDYLLRSLRHLAFELGRKDFYCVIMGSGDSLADLRALAIELRLEHFVEFTGYISEEDLFSNLAAADICVDPDPSSPLNDVSTWIKIMEYMAYAKPIVSYDLKETRFSAQDAAIYVKPNDERKFAEAIASLMDQPMLRKTADEFGRKRVEQDLQWPLVRKELLRAYETLLNTNGHIAEQIVRVPKRVGARPKLVKSPFQADVID